MTKNRHNTHQVKIGSVLMGGQAPVVVQSMTDTDTADRLATSKQIMELAASGSEIVRITVNNEEAAKQVAYIIDIVRNNGFNTPIVGDFHYNGHMLLGKYEDCAKALDKYRINPGNVGFGQKHDPQFKMMIEAALKYDKPVRIGVNWGSLDSELADRLMDENSQLPEPKAANEVLHEALVLSALLSAKKAEEIGLAADKIVISCKVSQVQDLIVIYRELAKRSNYALHLGLTEAGIGSKGVVASAAAMGVLLQEGIGDTIRTSLTPEPGASRTKEVIVSQELLQTMGIRSFAPLVTSCPGCGRTTSSFFRELADNIQTYLREQMPLWKASYVGVESMTVAVMGCIVNGPGESKHANIGISLPGNGESPSAPVFVDGKKFATLKGNSIAADFKKIVDEYIAQKYPRI